MTENEVSNALILGVTSAVYDENDARLEAHELIQFSGGDDEFLKSLIKRRLSGEPLQYIIGEWDFYNCNFRVGEGVLIPRPETEMLVDDTLDYLKARYQDSSDDATSMIYKVIYGQRVRGEYVLENTTPAMILDLCAGSGCIGISIAKNFPNCKVMAVEKSPEAFEYLKQNIALNRVKNVVPLNDDVLSGCKNLVELTKGKFDVIVSNPPYIRTDELETLQREVHFEPSMALDGGPDGLDFYRAIAERFLPLLRPGGLLLMECGEDQADDIAKILEAVQNVQLEKIYKEKDFNGFTRVIGAETKA